jgi:prepilin-type N-terminal cleavage/methylation domain-containing protein
MSRRGLTLVEVLAATVLLAAMSAVCIALVREARLAGEAEVSQADAHSLVYLHGLAEQVAVDQSVFGIEVESLTGTEVTGELDFDALRGDFRGPVNYRLLYPDEPEADHAWVVLTVDGAQVVVPVERPIAADERP